MEGRKAGPGVEKKESGKILRSYLKTRKPSVKIMMARERQAMVTTPINSQNLSKSSDAAFPPGW